MKKKLKYQWISKKRHDYVLMLRGFFVMFYFIGAGLYFAAFAAFKYGLYEMAFASFLAGTFFFFMMVVYGVTVDTMSVIDKLDWMRFRTKENYQRFREKMMR